MIVGKVGRNDIDFVGIVLDVIKDCFGKGTAITPELVIPSAGIVLGAEDG